MEPLLFQIVFEGRLKHGVDPARAAQKLAQAFRLNPESVQRLLSGRPVTIKRGLTSELAEKYKAALEGIGYDARIEQELTLDMPAAESEETKPDTVAAVPACPKCGHRSLMASPSPASDECPKCGVIISKYIASRKAGEPPAPEPPGAASASPSIQIGEGREIEFPQPGLLRLICALEFTLPETITLPPDEAPWEPASLKTRFFAALASLSAWVYCTFLFANIVGLIMLLLLMTGTLPRMSRDDAQGIMILVGLFVAAPYVFVLLPMHWNGLTYGQRLMGIWVAQKDWRDQPVALGAIMLRFAGTAVNFASWGVLNLVWPQIAHGRNLADSFTSTIQIQAQMEQAPSNPALAALKPIAYAFFFILTINLTVKPLAWYLARQTTQGTLQRSASQAQKTMTDPWTRVREIQDRQVALMDEIARGRPGSYAAPQTQDPVPEGVRNSPRGTSATEVLNKLAGMQKKYYAAHNTYSQDLHELLQMYGRGSFLNLNSISAMIRNNDLKMDLTSTGFEISMKIDGGWQTITERGDMDIRQQ